MIEQRRILIVDDELPIRKLLALAFRRAGYYVQTASGGREAIAASADQEFDVVLSDIMMPDVNGHEVVRSIVQLWPGTRFLLMSGFEYAQSDPCGAVMRPCSFLSKPFLPSQAIERVGELFTEAAA